MDGEGQAKAQRSARARRSRAAGAGAGPAALSNPAARRSDAAGRARHRYPGGLTSCRLIATLHLEGAGTKQAHWNKQPTATMGSGGQTGNAPGS